MCGIVGGFGSADARGLEAVKHRGPDARATVQLRDAWLGHARLAILDLDARSNQPFFYEKHRREARPFSHADRWSGPGIFMAYNGELWNHDAIRKELTRMGYAFETTGDTEVMAAALLCWNKAALPRLNGMFAVAWTLDGETLCLARDRFGEVPLSYSLSLARPFCFASERKALLAMDRAPTTIHDVQPGEVVTIFPGSDAAPTTDSQVRRQTWYVPPIAPVAIAPAEAADELHGLVMMACRDRAISDVPVCCLLSGGIDSAAVAYGLRNALPWDRPPVCYTAVMDERSPDLKAARLVACSLGLILREIRVPRPTPADLAGVVDMIEMPFKAQVEIGWACLQLAKAMRRDGFKVTFSGEGSDELWASYGFAYHGLKKQGWHEYRRDLFLDQARKNFQRCNKIFMAHGVECRLPFLHPNLVEFALSLPRDVVEPDGRQKGILQDAFAGLLPDLITRRPKLAFQDGLGLKTICGEVVNDPRKFYMRRFQERYGGLES